MHESDIFISRGICRYPSFIKASVNHKLTGELVGFDTNSIYLFLNNKCFSINKRNLIYDKDSIFPVSDGNIIATKMVFCDISREFFDKLPGVKKINLRFPKTKYLTLFSVMKELEDVLDDNSYIYANVTDYNDDVYQVEFIYQGNFKFVKGLIKKLDY